MYLHQLDAKNRMRIPAKFREQLGDDGYTITVGTGGCLYVYSAEQWNGMKDFLKKINPFNEAQMKSARYILSNAWEAEEDKSGRILLPENLRACAKISKNVVVLEGPECIEIWSEETWNNYFNDVNFASLADAFDKLKDNE